MITETQETHQSARTRFTIEAKGVRYAYRHFGKETGVPLLFLQHFLGTMDNWDPAVTDGLAKNRPVILFDSVGDLSLYETEGLRIEVLLSVHAGPAALHEVVDDVARARADKQHLESHALFLSSPRPSIQS